jgi:hypothetical protein
MDMLTILRMPLDQRACYCDVVVATAIVNKTEHTFLPDIQDSLNRAPNVPANWNIQMLKNQQNTSFSSWNSTSIGNLACMIVHSKNPEVKSTATALLDRFDAYMKPIL